MRQSQVASPKFQAEYKDSTESSLSQVDDADPVRIIDCKGFDLSGLRLETCDLRLFLL